MRGSQSFGGALGTSGDQCCIKPELAQNKLLGDIKASLMAEKFQCKPVDGHDVPLLGSNKAKIVEVENIDSTWHANTNELREPEKILQMLLPN